MRISQKLREERVMDFCLIQNDNIMKVSGCHIKSNNALLNKTEVGELIEELTALHSNMREPMKRVIIPNGMIVELSNDKERWIMCIYDGYNPTLVRPHVDRSGNCYKHARIIPQTDFMHATGGHRPERLPIGLCFELIDRDESYHTISSASTYVDWRNVQAYCITGGVMAGYEL